MSILDFKEIPEAHIATGQQDRFELFARDFLEYLEYKIVSNPNRGADGGKDLIIEEKRVGVGGETIVRWLVSCKHKVYSGNSVSPKDESNIRDRVEAANCHGFIGFYSTLPSSGLASNIEGLKGKIEVQVFDYEKIEMNLFKHPNGIELAERYFPKSVAEWKKENPTPAKIFVEEASLKCYCCGKELLVPESNGIIVLWQKVRTDYENEPKQYEEVYWCCKGDCDDILNNKRVDPNIIDGWEDISDIIIPTIFIKWIISFINQLQSGVVYSEQAFENMKEFILNVYPYIARQLTSEDEKRVGKLMQIPESIGGLGY